MLVRRLVEAVTAGGLEFDVDLDALCDDGRRAEQDEVKTNELLRENKLFVSIAPLQRRRDVKR